MSSPTNPYSSTSVSGFNASPPPDDGTRTSDNKVEWQKHVDKLGTPNKTAIESVDSNVSSAFGSLIITDYAAQEGNIIMMRMFS